jgi:protein SCO1
MAPLLLLSALAVAADPPPSRLAVLRDAPDFALTTQDGKTLAKADLSGRVVLVGFVFTTCTGTCPATTQRMAGVARRLAEAGIGPDRVRLVTITLDPARDTPEELRRYMRLFGIDAKRWSFLTGSPEQVAKVHAAWGMWAKPAGNGQIDHPSRVFLVDGKGRVREIYDLDYLKPAWVLEDVRLLLDEAAGPGK